MFPLTAFKGIFFYGGSSMEDLFCFFRGIYQDYVKHYINACQYILRAIILT